MSDILFQRDDYIFSYRVGGILLRENKILLQKPTNENGYAIPGGHVALGETNAQTLIREFKEEIGADITVGSLKWVAEIFFSWSSKPCHQICLYYEVTLIRDNEIPLSGVFVGSENIEGRNFKTEFHWKSIDSLGQLEVYPVNIADLMSRYNDGVQHFIYGEDDT